MSVFKNVYFIHKYRYTLVSLSQCFFFSTLVPHFVISVFKVYLVIIRQCKNNMLRTMGTCKRKPETSIRFSRGQEKEAPNLAINTVNLFTDYGCKHLKFSPEFVMTNCCIMFADLWSVLGFLH